MIKQSIPSTFSLRFYDYAFSIATVLDIEKKCTTIVKLQMKIELR